MFSNSKCALLRGGAITLHQYFIWTGKLIFLFFNFIKVICFLDVWCWFKFSLTTSQPQTHLIFSFLFSFLFFYIRFTIFFIVFLFLSLLFSRNSFNLSLLSSQYSCLHRPGIILFTHLWFLIYFASSASNSFLLSQG